MFRKKANMKQTELANLTGLAAVLISRYERGETIPNLDTAQKLAQGLGITLDELLNGSSQKEFEVKILMGVRSLNGVSETEIMDNTFLYGVQDDKPQIHIAGKVRIDTPELRIRAREMILEKFDAACWMFDHKDNLRNE